MRNSLSVLLAVILFTLQMDGRAYAEEIGSYSPPEERTTQAPPELKLKNTAAGGQSLRLDPPSDMEIQSLKENNSGQKGTEEKSLQIGFGRTVPAAIADAVAPQLLNWQPLATGGMAAQFTITSPGAAALRLALAVRKIPQGAEARFTGSANPNDVLGPVASAQMLKDAVYWSPMVEGDSATVEISLPPGAVPADLDFTLVNISHALSSPVKLNMNALQLKALAATCELDAVCYYSDPQIRNVATGVAKMLYTEPSTGLSYVCTGTLLNSWTLREPYFYTASHCISDQPTASTLITYWFYESAACNGTTLSPSARMLINGAELLYSSAVTDGALLRLVDPAPAGAAFVGWDSTAVSANLPFMGLHHPMGDFTKVTFGTTAGLQPFNGVGSYNAAVDTQGITEGGSSGSALFILNSTTGQYQLRGGLKGGSNSCANTAPPDSYSRFDLVFPDISRYLMLTQTDVRTYVPAAAAGGGYVSSLRIINKGTIPTPVTVTAIDGSTGLVSASGTLIASLPPQAAVTYSAQQVEAALGIALLASERPRIRVTANTHVEVQSFLRQPNGAALEVSSAKAGHTVQIVSTYVPAAASPSGYVSYLRIVNVGGAPTPVSVTKIDPVTGLTAATGVLTASLPSGAARFYSAAEVEAALGVTMTAGERPRIMVMGSNSLLDVQSWLAQPGGVYSNITTSKTGSAVDVGTYVPAAVPGYASYLRIVNLGNFSTPITVSLLDDVTGAASASAVLMSSLPPHAAESFSSSQVEAALGVNIQASARPRIRVSAYVPLEVNSFLLQPNGAYNEFTGSSSGTSVDVRYSVPAGEREGFISYVRVINAGMTATPVSVLLIDGDTGSVGGTKSLIASLPAGGATTLTLAQVEAALGVAIAPGSRPRLRIFGNTTLEVQSYLGQPDGTITEVSGGQSGAN
ncbi:MAG TPA: hypothetical protein VFF26_07460 [Gallionella sp.]|nr:hypothetical protein [Gallionella sp.]